MVKHPDGENLTRELISLASLTADSRILDMGAGDGEAVILLRSLGYDAVGIDLIPSENVMAGDMTCIPFEDNSFDIVISECAFSVCGDTEKAFSEAHRVLKKGGMLCISDVYFKSETSPCLSMKIPATKENWEKSAKGFDLKTFNDRTKVWTEFMIHCVWNGLDLGDCGYFKSAAKAKGGYFTAAFKKEETK